MLEQLLTIADAAKQLSVHPKTIAKEIEAGRLPVVKIRRALRIREADLQAYIKANTQTRGAVRVTIPSSTKRLPRREIGKGSFKSDPVLEALLAKKPRKC